MPSSTSASGSGSGSGAGSSSPPMTVAEIRTVHKELGKAMAEDAQKDIGVLLGKLKAGVVPTEDLIRTTKIGQIVGKLRTHSSSAISQQAKALVQGWKAVVDKERAAKGGASKEKGGESTTTTTASSSSSSKGTASTATASQSSQQQQQPGTPSVGGSASPAPPSASPAKSAGAAGATPQSSTASSSSSAKAVKAPDFTILLDKTRNACLKVLFDALKLAEVPGVDEGRIFGLALEIEGSILDKYGGGSTINAEYRNKVRSLSLNLKDKNNPSFRAKVVRGEVPARRLVDLTPKEMASEQRLAENRSLEEKNMLVAQSAKEQEAETDAFQCGRCKQRKCRYYQKQTRSADEPMTTFVTCTNCNNKWKFC